MLRAAQAAIKVAQANLAAQFATVQRLTELKGYEDVIAPYDGIITSRSVDTGDLVSADSNGSVGNQLFTLARDNIVRVQIAVPQSGAIGIKDGLHAKVHVPELPGRDFHRHRRAQCGGAGAGVAHDAGGSRRAEQ